MNIYVLASISAFLTGLFFGYFVYSKGRNNAKNKFFSIGSILTGIWCLLPLFLVIFGDNKKSLYSARVIYMFASFVPSVWLSFMFSTVERRNTRIIFSSYIVSSLFALLSFHPLFIKGTIKFAPFFCVVPGPLYFLFIVFFTILFIYILINFCIEYKVSNGYKKHQIIYLIWAFIIGVLGGIIHFLAAYIHKEPFPHDFVVIIYTLIVTYAIVKYRLMDIAVVITRTTIFLVTFSLVLGLPFLFVALGKDWLIKLLGQNWWIGPLILMAALGTSGPFIFFYVEKRIVSILLREQRRYQDALRRAAVDMTRIRNLQQLLDFIIGLFNNAVRVSHSAIYCLDSKTSRFTLKAGINLKNEQPPSIDIKNPLINWLENKKEPLLYEEIRHKAEDNPDSVFKELKEQMLNLNATVIVPCILEDKLFDILILGDKLSGKIYTHEDLNNFSELGREVALATENALLYGNIEEEVRQRTNQLIEVQKQLVQAEKLATVGTLAGGVAHEINNPLTAILTNVQMLLVDAEKLDSDSKESLTLIEEATKRCRTIVQKLMTYAKKPLESGELSDIDVLNILKKVISFLGYQLEQENIKIITEAKEGEYLITGSQNELEQVFTNIILNARDAIKKIKKSGVISVSVSKNNDWIEIKIKDDGIGIPKEIMPKIFDPFFTTKDVGKGLGLGLSICQAIVEKHKGTITVESELNKGALVTVRLPIAKAKIGKHPQTISKTAG